MSYQIGHKIIEYKFNVLYSNESIDYKISAIGPKISMISTVKVAVEQRRISKIQMKHCVLIVGQDYKRIATFLGARLELDSTVFMSTVQMLRYSCDIKCTEKNLFLQVRALTHPFGRLANDFMIKIHVFMVKLEEKFVLL